MTALQQVIEVRLKNGGRGKKDACSQKPPFARSRYSREFQAELAVVLVKTAGYGIKHAGYA